MCFLCAGHCIISVRGNCVALTRRGAAQSRIEGGGFARDAPVTLGGTATPAAAPRAAP